MTANQATAVKTGVYTKKAVQGEMKTAVRKTRPISAAILMVLLYIVFLLSLATVYAMNLYVISAYTAVGVLLSLSVAALLLLFRILTSK